MIQRTSVVVYVCTYRRNELLAECLDAIVAAARHAAPVADVGAVVVDDNADGRARTVVDALDTDALGLGLEYVHVGAGNISLARNAGLAEASTRAEWVAMTDDDCRPDPQWITELLAVQREGDYDAVTGPLHLTPAPGSPRWMAEQPFFDSVDEFEHGGPADIAYTNNSMIRSAFLVAHPDLRFDQSLGVVGGEDMVFYHRAQAAGLRIGYAATAAVNSIDDESRNTFGHLLHHYFWLGNTEATTNRRLRHAGAPRLIGRAGRRLARAIARPFTRLASRESPQWRYALACCTSAAGMFLGAFGLELDHPTPK